MVEEKRNLGRHQQGLYRSDYALKVAQWSAQ